MTKKIFCVKGTHCASCEVIIERALKKIPGVTKVEVDRAEETVAVESESSVSLKTLQLVLKKHNYQLLPIHHKDKKTHQISWSTRFGEIGAALIIILGVFLLLKALNLLPDQIGITSDLNFGVAFVMGLLAATSTCLAVSGGLLLALSTEYKNANPDKKGWQLFKPHIFFNIGRVLSYTILGGLIGYLGSLIAISAKVNGIITILVSMLMIILGIQLLQVLPWLNRLPIKMPKIFANLIHDQGKIAHTKLYSGAFLLGAATFFLPCGFTQALQLYVLSSGSFTDGALIMFAFSLGTLPAFIGIGAIASAVKGEWQRYFTTFAAVLIIILGVFTLPSGMVLAGINTSLPSSTTSDDSLQSIPVQTTPSSDGNTEKQIIDMSVVRYSYYPSTFTVKVGIPVEWRIDGKQAAGCAQVLTSPKLGITEFLSRNEIKVITFTPQKEGIYPFSCSMGMTTPGAHIKVVSS